MKEREVKERDKRKQVYQLNYLRAFLSSTLELRKNAKQPPEIM
jgi:hypothetical protein